MLLNACTSMEEMLNKEFVGREVYLCEPSFDGTAYPGKKIIKNITCTQSKANSCKINLLNENGSDESIGWYQSTSNYIGEMNVDLVSRPYCSLNKYKEYILEKQKKEEAQKTEEKNIIEDCKQAKEKARQRKEDIRKAEGNLLILDDSITYNDEGRTSNWSFGFKVVGYDNIGIIVESSCTFSPIANILLNAFVGCENKNYFIYTSDDYADGECYKNWQYLHKDAGVYNWNGKRIRAFRKTNYKISEIEYQTYLKDKKHQCN